MLQHAGHPIRAYTSNERLDALSPALPMAAGRGIVAGVVTITAAAGEATVAQRRGKGQGNVGRRKEGGRWYGRLDLGRDGTGKRTVRTVNSRTRDGAATKLQPLLGAQGRGLPVARDRATIGAFLDEWLEQSVAPTVRPRTRESYAQIVREYLALGEAEGLARAAAQLPRVIVEGRAPDPG
jgi:hypothetical protein